MAIAKHLARKRLPILLAWLALSGLALVGCTSVQYQADRLSLRVDKATQQDIAEFFGPPHTSNQLPNGETEWRYRYLRTASGGTAVVGKRTCWEHILRFDRETVLREHRRVSC